ncbi:hypothetical protein OROGR_023044 [Orobanche gracilis]
MKKRVARILVFKIRPSQEILKIRDDTPFENKRVARILVFKIRPSQENLKIRDGTPLEKKRVARILVFKIRPSQEILKIHDGTPLEAEEILTYKKSPRNGSVWHFSSKLDVPSNVLQKKRVARFLVFKIRPSQEILKIRDGTPLERMARILVFKIRPSQEILKILDGTPFEAEEILIYRKKASKRNKRVARILVFKIRPSQENLKIRDGTPLEKKRVARILVFKIRPSQEILKIRDGTPLEKKRVARILVFKIRPSQKILKIRDGTPLEAEEILTYKKSLRNGSFWHFSSKLDVPSNVLKKNRVARILVFKIRPSQEILKIRDGTPLEKKRVARILVFKIRPSQKILKIRDGTPLEAEEILTYKKSLRNGSVWHFSSKLHVPSNVLQKKRVARILVFKIRPSQEILKIRDGTPLEAEEILTYKKKPSKWIVKKRVAQILVFKIRPSQKILKIRDGTPLEAEEILTYKKSLRNGSFWHFSSKLDVPSNVLKKNRVARILVFKIRPSQEILKIRDGTPLEKKRVARILVFKIRSSQKILKIRDGTPLEAEEILTYKKSLRNGSVWHFSSKLHVPSNVLQKKRVARILVFKIRPFQEILKIRDGTPLEKKRVARILVFKIRPSQKILKIRDGTPLEAEEILTYKKSLRNGSVWHFSSKLHVPSNVLQKKRVARILVFKIRPSQEILKIRDGTPLEKKRVARILVFKIRPSQKILKIRDGTPLEAEEILTYKKSLRNGSFWHFSSKLDVPSNVLKKNRVARILVFKIRPSQKILKIRDGTPLEAEEILTYKKSLRNGSVWHFSSKLHVPSNVLQKKRVARILVFKIRPFQEILKIRDGTPLEKKRVARILVFKIRPSQKILKIRDGTPLEAEEILTYKKSLRNGSVWHFSSKLHVPSNVLQKKRVARILVFKIRPSQKILKIRDGTPLKAEEILTYKKSLRNGSFWHFSSKLDVPSNVLKKNRVARILVFKIRPSQKILKIRDGTPLEAEEILTYKKSLRNGSVWHFSSKLHVPSNVLQKKRVARILVFKIRPSQKILKIRDGTPLEAEEILTYKKSLRNGSVWHFSSKLHVPSNVLQKKRVARILVFKIRPSQEILKIRDGTPLEKKRVAQILVFKIRPSQKILKIRDGTPLEAEEILTYKKSLRNGSFWHFSSKLDVPSNVLKKNRVARILVFKIRPSQEILKIRDGTPLEAEEILKYRKKPSKRIVARILVFKIRSSQKILKIRDGTPLEAEEILTYKKSLRNGSVWHFSSKLHVPSNVLQKKRVARILVFKIRPFQEILKIRDGTPLEKKRVARILVFKIRPSQKILKIRDGTPLEAEEILTYKKSLRNGSVWHFSSKLHVPSNVLQKKRVARILVFKIRPSQEILKIRDGTPLEKKRVARILVFKIRPSQKILKIRDGTPLEAEEILTYKKSLRNGSFWHFSSKLDVPSNVLKKNRVARILVFKIRPSQKILKIRDGTPLEAEEILTYKKSLRNGSVWHFSSKLHVPSNVLQKKRVARILVFKIRPFQEILKIRDGTPLEKKRVARILVFKIRPSQKILKIRDGTPLEAEEILTYKKSLRNGSVWHFSSKLHVPSNVLQKKRVARILVFKIRPSQKILKIRDGTPLKAEEILTYKKSLRNGSFWHFSSKLDVPSNVLKKNRVARILVFKIRPSQKILKIRDGTPLEAEEILTYKKSLRNGSVWHFSSKLHVPSNVLQKKRVARILVFKIRPFQEILKIRDGTPLEKKRVARILVFKIRPSQKILKIRDGTPLEAEEILTYKKSLRNGSVWHFSSKLHVPSNVLQKKRVARILVFKIRPSQEILKIRDGTPLEAEEILTYKKKPSKWIVARILVFKIRPSQEILKIRDGTPLEKKRVARILVFKIRPSQEILKIRDGTPLEKKRKKRVARILVFKIRPSQKILKICDGTPLEAEEILTYKKSLRNGSVWHFSSKLHVPSNVLQKKRVARILVFKIRPSQKILKIRDGTPLEAEEILTYKKSLRNGSVWHFSSKLHVPSNVLQKKRVARILVFKIRPSQEILKIRDGTPLEAEEILTYKKKPSKWIEKRVARILVFKIRPSQEILKIRDGTPLEAEEILKYRKKPSKR